MLLVLAGIFINTSLTRAFIELPLASFLNILGGIFLGVMIWIAGLWSAADAKLFMAINFLFPVTFYKYSSGYFPGISILINFALPLFLFLFFQIILKTSFKEKKEALFSYFKLSFIAQLFLTILALHCITFFISHFLKIRIEYLIWLALLLLLFWFIEQKLKIRLTYFFFAVILFTVVISLIFNLSLFNPYSLSFILAFFLPVLLLFVMLKLGTALFTNSVKIENLKEGMIPAEMIVEEKGNYIKKSITFLTFLSLLRQRTISKPLIGFNADGLGKEELEEIRSLCGKGLLQFEELKISLTMPFAPVLFFGALLTYFLRGPLTLLF